MRFAYVRQHQIARFKTSCEYFLLLYLHIFPVRGERTAPKTRPRMTNSERRLTVRSYEWRMEMVIVRLEATLPSSFSAVHSGRRAAALEIRIAALAVPNDMDNCRRRRARSFILSRRFFVRSRTHLPAMAESAAHHVFSVCFW